MKSQPHWHPDYSRTPNARHGHPRQTYRTASFWQNGFAERLIGSIQRECVDQFIVLGEAHLRHILRTYARYYNHIRTHWSLDKDTPVYRPVQRIGSINSHAILGGLHHHYVRV
ncbi:MAG: integrase core domain-containing protein [Pseudolabrys sp.]